MFAKVNSFGVRGLAGFAVTAEADISGGLPQLSIVGDGIAVLVGEGKLRCFRSNFQHYGCSPSV